MLAAFCHALLADSSPAEAATYGHAAAVLTIATDLTVREDLTWRMIETRLAEGCAKQRQAVMRRQRGTRPQH